MTQNSAPHVPVLLRPLLQAVSPVQGVWIDGTFGAGGYTRGLIEAGADKVIGIDQDPLAHRMAAEWIGDWPIELVQANFAQMDQVADAVDGVVLDLGVSSMQLDLAERGFSFLRDGPLDMRMSQDGPSAADIVNTASADEIADILFLYGEERQSRRIARKIVDARALEPFETTLQLAELIEKAIGRTKPGQAHAATRSFQALRIAVNDEYGALWQGLMAAERVLKPGGLLAVVTFHSIEDRMVKRFFQAHGDKKVKKNRYAREDEAAVETPFEILTRKAVGPDAQELSENPRSRSAKLRVARRTSLPAQEISGADLSMPDMNRRT
ncbi:16S rRNA (cytosine(1402)-N(4))-methyltransferase RsmH [Tropicibacter naphthalenivorans]|uniref:Ribosomal RNA small subunit methyltransferase H n=1 Tax=Tropicibacter naphthalenivorans TaxID=441103 RepID=A0A0P1G329_9RHOB|nr:16S rRNA (cytosine(1402)-N(4))-methyltransferase RsmH [Tropicibacter naphthalenivorans]CUH76070.1 Ribosomal RNA small subunit methyltransferase H [Tropicibacter naphthalenivorans]SMC40209.1 16S rRNA (cytosine1402-N4)-methyltransferase [Tropicibacter naphthalenivorans]